MQMANEKYIRLTKTFNDKGILIKPEEINKYVTNPEIPHYISPYYYNQEHFNKFQETGSVAGFENLVTDKIWWDFDSKEQLRLAKNDTLTLIDRLSKHVNPNSLEIFFSGSKGFHVILNLKQDINQKQVKNFAMKFAKDLKTFDTVVYNENRYLRLEGTKHQTSGYYKIPLTYDELKTIKKEPELLEKAKVPSKIRNLVQKIDLDPKLLEFKDEKEIKQEIKELITKEFDLTTVPKTWKSSKWALMQGFFKGGERDNAMMVLSATLKSKGFDQDQTFGLCETALKRSWAKYGEGNFSLDDLNEKIERVYSKEWNIYGEVYNEKTDIFLQKKAEELGIRELTQTTTVDIKGALKMFQGYAKHIDELTLKTGIKELDEKQRITVGMSWGIIAGPGSGKTSVALQILHAMSKAGELCILFSYDMFGPHVIQKIIQTHWEDSNIEEVFEKYKKGDQVYTKKVEELIEREYPNVEFCFESGQSIDDARSTIRDAEQKRGKKCKFVVFDYNELVITDVADPTQSSNKVAQQIRSLAGNEQICVLSLFQPNKLTGDPSTEIKSYRAAKGGSGIEQSVSLMFGMSRPGFDPRKPSQDKFVSLNCVKNRMGSIFALDLFWDGYRGLVKQLTSQQKSELAALRKALEDEKNGASDDSW